MIVTKRISSPLHLTGGKKSLVWSIQRSYLASHRAQKQAQLQTMWLTYIRYAEQNYSIAGYPLRALTTAFSQPCGKDSSYIRTWHSLGLPVFSILGKKCSPCYGLGCDEYSAKLHSLGFTLKWFHTICIMTSFSQLLLWAQQTGLCSYRIFI